MFGAVLLPLLTCLVIHALNHHFPMTRATTLRLIAKLKMSVALMKQPTASCIGLQAKVHVHVVLIALQ